MKKLQLSLCLFHGKRVYDMIKEHNDQKIMVFNDLHFTLYGYGYMIIGYSEMH